MGSLVVKLDKPIQGKLENRYFYSDVDMLSARNGISKEVPMVYDVDAVRQSVRNILMWRVGESVLSPEFGHNLQKSMYEQMNDFNKDKVCQEIQRAIEENEPRVEVENVGVKPSDDDDDNALSVRVIFTVVGNKAEGAKLVEETKINGK